MRLAVLRGVAFLAAVTVSSCASVSRIDSVGDIHAFLVAVRNDDQALFDRHIDKSSVFANATRANPAAGLTAAALSKPRTYRAVAAAYGFAPGKRVPGRTGGLNRVRSLDYSQVCLSRSLKAPCQMTFALQGEVWRLIAVQDVSLLDPS
jgi:hypothetical protein